MNKKASMFYLVRPFISKYLPSKMCRLLTVVLSFILFSACSNNFTVKQTFPRPLIESIPVTVNLNLTEEFKNYSYEEANEGRTKITVNIGSAQAVLFETMSEYMFSGKDQDEVQLTITPSIEDFQYAIPRETRAEIYEIWLKYRVTVSDSENETIADWLITGYGKTPTAFLKSQQQAIDSAAGIALRDIGSQLSIGFSRQPDIQAWLEKNTGEQG